MLKTGHDFCRDVNDRAYRNVTKSSLGAIHESPSRTLLGRKMQVDRGLLGSGSGVQRPIMQIIFQGIAQYSDFTMQRHNQFGRSGARFA